MNLSELQQAFQNRVLHGAHAIDPFVPGTEQFDTPTRLGVYEYAFTSRLIEALAKTYSALQFALGDKQFGKLIVDYVKHKPPSHFSIRYYGSDLSSFIESRFSGTKAKGLSELARWEWLLTDAFDSRDVLAIDRDAIASIAPDRWPQLRFTLSPSFHRMVLSTNALQWWKAHDPANALSRPTRWRVTPHIEWAIWRTDLKTYFRSLKADEAHAIDTVLRGESFSNLCESLAEFGYADQAPLRAATLLSQWLSDGWIVAIQLK